MVLIYKSGLAPLLEIVASESTCASTKEEAAGTLLNLSWKNKASIYERV